MQTLVVRDGWRTCEVINVTGGDLLPGQVAVLAVDDDLPTAAHTSKHCGEVAQGSPSKM